MLSYTLKNKCNCCDINTWIAWSNANRIQTSTVSDRFENVDRLNKVYLYNIVKLFYTRPVFQAERFTCNSQCRILALI